MDKQAELKQWITIADNDFDAANHLANNMRPVPYEIICFHCQQAAEKYLKWFLVLHDREPPKIHDLEELEKLCETISPAFSALLDKCSYLTVYGVQSRYPSVMQLEKEDMDRALAYAELIREFVRTQAHGQFDTDDETHNIEEDKRK
jgi:HEPN domain-containing protein